VSRNDTTRSVQRINQVKKGCAEDAVTCALDLYASGKYREALTTAERFLSGRSDHVICLNLAAGCAKMLGETDAAESYWQRALQVFPRYADAHYNLGELLAARLRWSEAESAYRRAIEIDPTHANAYNNLGVMLTELRRYPEAETAFHNAIRINPTLVEAYNNLGAVLIELKRFAAAEATYR